jgi:hypothetical protein
MPDKLRDMKLSGGPAQPVYLMNGVPGGDGAAYVGSNVAVYSTTIATAGNNTIIAAPAAGKRIVVYTLMIQNESANVTTILVKDQVNRWRALLAQYGWFVLAFGLLVSWKLNAATALVINLSGANTHSVSVQYSIEDI